MRSVVNGRLAVLPLAAVFALGLAACTSSTQGTGTAVPPSPAGSSSASSPSSTASASGTASLQPCNLLTSTEVSENELSGQGTTNDGGVRGCDWANKTADGGLGYAMEVAIRDSQGLADITTSGNTITNDPVGSHQGKQVQDSVAGACFVAIGVTAKSRIDVLGSASNGNMSESCTIANKYAKIVEAKLS
jgi:hypothetical protein